MAEDPELRAIAAVKRAVEGLDQETRVHVVRWAMHRYNVRPGRPRTDGGPDGEYETLADLFAAADPDTTADRVLVVGFWLQVVNDAPTFAARTVNGELQDLGHPIPSINKVFDRLMATRPQLVRQKRKRGPSQQARKDYSLTGPGKNRVRELLAGG